MPLPDPIPHHLERLASAAFDEARAQAAAALGQYPDRSLELLPHLVKALGDPGPVVVAAAAQTLGAFGADAAAAIPHLERQRAHDDRVVRNQVEESLAKIQASS